MATAMENLTAAVTAVVAKVDELKHANASNDAALQALADKLTAVTGAAVPVDPAAGPQ